MPHSLVGGGGFQFNSLMRNPIIAALDVPTAEQAVQLAVEISGGARNTLYKRALELKKSAS